MKNSRLMKKIGNVCTLSEVWSNLYCLGNFCFYHLAHLFNILPLISQFRHKWRIQMKDSILAYNGNRAIL